MATQAQKDKAVLAAAKRLATAQKRVDRLAARISSYDELVATHDLAVKGLTTAQAEVDWAESRPVIDDADTDEDADTEE